MRVLVAAISQFALASTLLSVLIFILSTNIHYYLSNDLEWTVNIIYTETESLYIFYFMWIGTKCPDFSCLVPKCQSPIGHTSVYPVYPSTGFELFIQFGLSVWSVLGPRCLASLHVEYMCLLFEYQNTTNTAFLHSCFCCLLALYNVKACASMLCLLTSHAIGLQKTISLPEWGGNRSMAPLNTPLVRRKTLQLHNRNNRLSSHTIR